MAIGSTRKKSRLSRRAIIAVSMIGLTITVGSLGVLRYSSLRGLPDIGDPFDVAKYARIDIPADENAYTFYRRASEMSQGINCPRSMSSTYSDWALINAEEFKYLEDSRAAMAVWLEGTKRNRAVYIQPGEYTFEALLPVPQDARNFCRRINLQAFKLQHEGDLEGSWAWVRANLRCGRHIGMNGSLIERVVGFAIFMTTSRQARIWADDPRVDAKMLGKALDDVLALDALERTPSQAVRSEYFSGMNGLRDQQTSERIWMMGQPANRTWTRRVWGRIDGMLASLRHEPERSRRVWRLITANWLAACDLPNDERSRRIRKFGALTLYTPAPDVPSAMSPEEIARWFETSRYAKEFISDWMSVDKNVLAREETGRAELIVHLAEQMYLRDNGELPETAEELVGPYLKAIPIGYSVPTDASKTQGPPR
jgi:hypothetical protein